jgi:hypothetical protein
LDELEKSKTARDPPVGDLVQTEALRPRRAPSDSGGRRLARAHGFAASVSHRPFPQLAPPPSTALRNYKGCKLDSSFPLFASITSAPPSSLPLPGLPSSTSMVPALSVASPPSRPILDLWYSAVQLTNPVACRLDRQSLRPPPVHICSDCHRRRELHSVSFWCPCLLNRSTTPPPYHSTFSPPISGAGLPESPTTVAAQRPWASRSRLPCFR